MATESIEPKVAPGLAELVPPVILGCGGLGGVGSDPAHWGTDAAGAADLLDGAIQAGVTWLDTSNSYGDGASERIIGKWLRDAGPDIRERIFLCTKVGQPTGRHHHSRRGLLSRREILRSIDESLRRLGVDHIDLYLAHHLDRSVSMRSLLASMNELVASGKARYWGLSNVPAWLVVDLIHECRRNGWEPPLVVQNGFSLLQDEDRRHFEPLTQRFPTAYTPHSPLAGGWLAGAYRARGPYPPASRMALRPGPYAQWESSHTRAAVEVLAQVAAANDATCAQIALAWVRSHSFVTAPIVGPSDPTELAQIVEGLGLELDTADLDLLEAAFGPRPHTSSFRGCLQP